MLCLFLHGLHKGKGDNILYKGQVLTCTVRRVFSGVF